MKRTSQVGTKAIIKNILLGLLAGMLATILLTLLVAIWIHNGTLAESRISLVVAPMQFVAVLIACLLAGKRAGQKYAIICGATAMLYCTILLSATILLFDSEFNCVGLGIGMCTAGCVCSCAICMMKKGKKRKRRN